MPYDELVKRLRDNDHEIDCRGCERDCCYPDGISSGKCIIMEAADAIERLKCFNALWQEAAKIAHEREPKWIPVTERLPEESWERVLAYTDDGTVMTLPAIKLRNGYVRYWMPLPEPPKEET